MVFSTLGASNSPASRQSLADGFSPSTDTCATQTVRITLASEQIEFCAPTGLPINVVEDNISVPYVSYSGLNQLDGYGFAGIKATSPGYAPGIDRPVYNLGEIVKYRQVVWDREAAKTDRSVSNGPSAVFWDETVPGMQVDFTLPTLSGNLQIRSIEWYVEHANRLWSFIIRWDKTIQNSGEWEAASTDFSVQESGYKNLADTATDLGAASQKLTVSTEVTSQGGPVDVGAPKWWSGVCDDDNYYADPNTHGVHSVPLGASWHGVLACGPVTYHDPYPSHLVHFFSGAWGEYEFQCVELVMRFLYQEWGIAPWGGNANEIAYSDDLPNSLVFYSNGTHDIVPGDIITEDGLSPGSAGHAVIVTNISGLDATGTGSITIMEQNTSSDGDRPLQVKNWKVDPDAYTYGQTIQGWLHAKANTYIQKDGDYDMTFSTGTGPNDDVHSVALQPDGKVLIAGKFISYNNITRHQIARLGTDGSVDTTFDPGSGVSTSDGSAPVVYALAIQSDNKILIGGHFTAYQGTTRNHIARLTSTGLLDTTFTPETLSFAEVYKIAVQPDNKILVGGDRTIRLNSNGTKDTSFNCTTGDSVRDLAIQLNGKIIIAGDFSRVNNIGREGIARLNSNGSLDMTFDPGSGTSGMGIASISLLEDGKILIGGNFTTFNGISRNKVARLNSDGSLDLTFDPGIGISGSSEFVQTIKSQSDGRILIGGDFSSYNGTPLRHLGRLNYEGSLETTFYPEMDGEVDAMVLQPDSRIIIGGKFTDHLERLLNHVEPCYTLNAAASPPGAGSVIPNHAPNCPGSKYINGTGVQLTANPNSGYEFTDWREDMNGSTNPIVVTVSGNKSVIANFGMFDGVKIYLPLVTK